MVKWFIPRRPLFLHAISFEWTTKLSQLYQPIYLSFSYLNSVRHNLVIELCREQFFSFFTVPEKIIWSFFGMVLFLNNALFHHYFSLELTILCLTKIISLGFQPKTPPFSTHHIIWVKYEVLGQISQYMSLLFSYSNSVRHNLVIEFCREQK